MASELKRGPWCEPQDKAGPFKEKEMKSKEHNFFFAFFCAKVFIGTFYVFFGFLCFVFVCVFFS